MLDVAGSGKVSFDEFIVFMGDEHADAETSAQLLDAGKLIKLTHIHLPGFVERRLVLWQLSRF